VADNALVVAEKAWDKWVAGDVDGFLSMWDPAGEWTISGQSQISGTTRGHEDIRRLIELMFRISDGTLKARPLELARASEDAVLGYYHLEAHRRGASIDQDGFQRILTRTGKIVSLHNVAVNQYEIDEFFM
jgi:ketosteroid isomerase-like protein